MKFINKVRQSDFCSVLNSSVVFAIEQYLQLGRILKEITMAIHNLSKVEPFLKVQKFLQGTD
jgi:hypothetical protein